MDVMNVRWTLKQSCVPAGRGLFITEENLRIKLKQYIARQESFDNDYDKIEGFELWGQMTP